MTDLKDEKNLTQKCNTRWLIWKMKKSRPTVQYQNNMIICYELFVLFEYLPQHYIWWLIKKSEIVFDFYWCLLLIDSQKCRGWSKRNFLLVNPWNFVIISIFLFTEKVTKDSCVWSAPKCYLWLDWSTRQTLQPASSPFLRTRWWDPSWERAEIKEKRVTRF